MITINQLIGIIKESLEEMPAYHGSGNDFDKFNHKKYLGGGCGSQCFGWGTYVTDDRAIGDSYADKFKRMSERNGEPAFKDGYKFDPPNIEWQLNNMGFPRDFLRRHHDCYCKEGEAREFYQVFKSNIVDGKFDTNAIYKYFVDKTNRIIERELKSFEGTKFYDKHHEIYKEMQDKYLERISLFIDELNKKCKVLNIKPTLYEVDIPDDTGNNYLNWNQIVSQDILNRIISGFDNLPKKYYDMAMNNDSYGYIDMFKESKNLSGKTLYYDLTDFLGSKKAASLYLLNCCGIIGIKYESGTLMNKPDGAKDDGYNYVLFDANDVKIINKETL